LTFELWNVLAQLSVTCLVAFLFMRKPASVQIGFTFLLLIATDLLYRLWPVAGFNQPFVPDHNFGSWMDLVLMHKLSDDHWVAFNAIPTTAHTMWGVLAGQVLQSSRAPLQKIRILVIPGLIGVVVGFTLNPWIPMIKRTCTSSFVIVSGGWCLLALALSYWLIDVRKLRKWSVFFSIVGMNPLFIYLFTNTGGAAWFHRIARPFTMGLFAWSGTLTAEIVTSVVVWAMLWYVCYWLYKKRIFIRL
jgi:predicted acyltransferase